MKKIILTIAILITIGLFLLLFQGGRLLTDSLMASNQLPKVLEVYYSDHGHYPRVAESGDLVRLLARKGYLQARLSKSVFTYKVRSGGQDYSINFDN